MSKCNYFGRKLPYGIYPVVIGKILYIEISKIKNKKNMK